jgi:hypothetical protein
MLNSNIENKVVSGNKYTTFVKTMTMEKQEKPDWITDKQWNTVPSVAWWEDSKKQGEYIEQSKPATVEEVQAQFSRLRNEKNWNQGV